MSEQQSDAEAGQLAIHKTIQNRCLDSFEKVKEFFKQAPYHFKVVEDDEKNLYLLKYNQKRTEFSHPEAREARGIILCKKTNKVVCYPFNKFFNDGEKYADEIDWETACVFKKEDGSLIKVYFHDGEWHVATNGTIDAKNAEPGDCEPGRTFRDLFDEAAPTSGFHFDNLDKSCSYMFELLHPDSLIVVRHTEPRLVHLATRHNESYEELHHDVGVPHAEEFPLRTLEQCKTAANALGCDQEGFVVRDRHGRRVKIKGPVYVKLHHMLTSLHLTEEETAALLVLKGEQSEIGAYGREDDRIALLVEAIAKMEGKIDSAAVKTAQKWLKTMDDLQNNNSESSAPAATSRKSVAIAFQKQSKNLFPFFMKRYNFDEKRKQARKSETTDTAQIDVDDKEKELAQFFRQAILQRYTSQKVTKSDAKAFIDFLNSVCEKK